MFTPHVLIIDDDPFFCRLVERALKANEVTFESVYTLADARRVLQQKTVDTVLLDLDLPDGDGRELVEEQRKSKVPYIVLTANTHVEVALQVVRMGAYDYLTKPLDKAKLQTTVARATQRIVLERKLERLQSSESFAGIVGQTPLMLDLFQKIERLANSDVPVAIHGESGSGKELVARALHDRSERAKGPFVALNCAAFAESLQESELFGHEKGAFTGALGKHAGLIEQAHGGTLFLDEVAELSAALQAKLLRVLQEKKFRRLGGTQDLKSDFRVVSATHKDLTTEVQEERFRADLYFRLAVFELHVPPLRERRDDIPLLIRHFLNNQSEEELTLSPEALSALTQQTWEGNVRELQNALRYAAVLQEQGRIDVDHLPERLRPQRAHHARQPQAPKNRVQDDSDLGQSPMTLAQIEERAIRAALARHNYNVSEAVRELGIGRTTLYRKMKTYRIEILRSVTSRA